MRPLLLILCLLSASAAGAEPSFWATSGAWEISVDPDVGNGCFAQRVMDDGTTVRFGAVPSRNGGFFSAYNSDWTDIEVGETAVVEFDFGGARFAGEAVGAALDGTKGGYVFFDNPAFVEEFGKRYSVRVKVRGEDFAEFDLSGTSNAISGVLECQSEQPEAPGRE